MGRLPRYLAREYLKAFVATLLAVCSIYLVVDYVDRSKAYTGEGWQLAVLELYANKAVTVAYQLAPAALVLAAGLTAAGLRRRGEYTALRALAIGPLQLLRPLLLVGLVLAGGLSLLDEYVVGPASRRADEINTLRFRSWGDWRFYFGEIHWLRGKRHIYHLRDGDPDRGFSGVTIYTLSEDFRLASRIDARQMLPLGGRRFKLVESWERELGPQSAPLRHSAEREVELDESASTFRIAKGRPEQMGLGELREQVRRREELGLPSERYRLALHNKLAYPLAGVPGGALLFALAVRAGRRSFLASALAEGFFLIVALWALLVFCKASTLAGYLSPATSAWVPVGVLCLAAAAGLKRWAR